MGSLVLILQLCRSSLLLQVFLLVLLLLLLLQLSYSLLSSWISLREQWRSTPPL